MLITTLFVITCYNPEVGQRLYSTLCGVFDSKIQAIKFVIDQLSMSGHMPATDQKVVDNFYNYAREELEQEGRLEICYNNKFIKNPYALGEDDNVDRIYFLQEVTKIDGAFDYSVVHK